MAATTRDLSNLDFDSIKTRLKEYLKAQNEFVDYDFDGSGLSVLLDLLSYNTHMNGMMAHMVMNESFIDTAQIRANVVSHANLLGYTPRSINAAQATLNVVFQGDVNSPGTVTLPANFPFYGRINNTLYTFIPGSTVVANLTPNDYQYVFDNLTVYEGSLKVDQFIVDGFIQYQKYPLTSKNVDTNSLKCVVYDSVNSAIGTAYTLFNNVGEVSESSEIFFLSENRLGGYQIYFGDNAMGKQPDPGSKIEISYIATSGKEANNINVFSAQGNLGVNTITGVNVTTIDQSHGGADQEDIESIRFYAPQVYATQDRAVTAADYRSLLLTQFPEIKDVSVWGGEDNDPPQYGFVFTAISLVDDSIPTDNFLDSITNYLKTKSVASIIPKTIKAEYTDVKLYLGLKVNTDRTDKTLQELVAITQEVTLDYVDMNLNKFDGVFRQSNLLAAIDRANSGFVSSISKLQMYKSFQPNPTKSDNYEIKFPTKIRLLSNDYSISTAFSFQGINTGIGDTIDPASPNVRRLFFYDILTKNKIKGFSDVGYIDAINGLIVLENIQFTLSNPISLLVQPNSFDIAPKYDQLLRIKPENITIEAVLDTVSMNGQSGLSSYTTFDRD